MKTGEIPIRDPFVLPLTQSGFYYLFGTTDKNPWSGKGDGFDCSRSRNLSDWERPVTPKDWQCLDGTLHLDEECNPWIVFCHEWLQVHNGAMYAMRLSGDLKHAIGRPVFLFNASEAPWVHPHSAWAEVKGSERFPTYVTDGPFLYRTNERALLMLWSSMGQKVMRWGLRVPPRAMWKALGCRNPNRYGQRMGGTA